MFILFSFLTSKVTLYTEIFCLLVLQVPSVSKCIKMPASSVLCQLECIWTWADFDGDTWGRVVWLQLGHVQISLTHEPVLISQDPRVRYRILVQLVPFGANLFPFLPLRCLPRAALRLPLGLRAASSHMLPCCSIDSVAGRKGQTQEVHFWH